MVLSTLGMLPSAFILIAISSFVPEHKPHYGWAIAAIVNIIILCISSHMVIKVERKEDKERERRKADNEFMNAMFE